jgi:hypothetical protein
MMLILVQESPAEKQDTDGHEDFLYDNAVSEENDEDADDDDDNSDDDDNDDDDDDDGDDGDGGDNYFVEATQEISVQGEDGGKPFVEIDPDQAAPSHVSADQVVV